MAKPTVLKDIWTQRNYNRSFRKQLFFFFFFGVNILPKFFQLYFSSFKLIWPQIPSNLFYFSLIKTINKLWLPCKYSVLILKKWLKTVRIGTTSVKFNEKHSTKVPFPWKNPTKTEFYKQLRILIEVPFTNSSHDFTAYKCVGCHILHV